MSNYYFHHSGGLGDIMWPYFKQYHHQLLKLKQKEPYSIVTYIACSDNKQVTQFYKNNPMVNKCLQFPMADYHKRTWEKQIQNKISLIEKYPVEESIPVKEFWLDKIEQDFANKILSLGKYVAVHPTGGTNQRTMIRSDFSLTELINIIIDMGYNVVLLGGNSDLRKQNVQKFEHKNPKCFNLLDKFTCRLHGYLTAYADGFVGVSSCYSVVAAAFNVNSLIYYPMSLKWWAEGTPPQVGIDGFSQAFRDNNNMAEYFEQPSDTTENLLQSFFNRNN